MFFLIVLQLQYWKTTFFGHQQKYKSASCASDAENAQDAQNANLYSGCRVTPSLRLDTTTATTKMLELSRHNAYSQNATPFLPNVFQMCS